MPDQQPRFAPRSPSEAIKPMIAPPPPPRHRRPRGGLLSAISGFLTLLIALAIGAAFGIGMLEREVTAKGPLEADKVVVIPRSGTNEIAELLKREGVIDQPLLFEVYALLNRQRGQLKAGEFLFKAGISIDDAIDTLVQGKAILHSITIPEGLTSEQIVARLKENEILTGDVAEMPREGALLPDTYKFERGMTRQQIVNAMQNAQRQALNQIWQRRSPDLPFKTPEELVILASIVEKETGRADERTRVAGVFINRLAKRMKLQSDPTIVYGLVGGKGTLGRGILKSEIEKATPYNTYAIEGLPPGPDRQSGPRRPRGGRQSFAHEGPLLRRRRHGRPCLRRDLRPASAERRALAPDREGARRRRRGAGRPGRARRARRCRRGTAPDGRCGLHRRDDPGPRRADDAAAPSGERQAAAPGARRGVDATEGTAKDPLLNKTYDLNSPKTVPALRQP